MPDENQNDVPDHTDEISAERHRQIDRLASGDLNETEQCELLVWLEADQVRWRRCGMALIEAQVLRQALATLSDGSAITADERIGSKPGGAPTVTVGRPSRRRKLLARAIASAAALLAAFTIGWFSRGVDHEPGTSPGVARGAADYDAKSDSQEVVADARNEGDPSLPKMIGIARLLVGQGSDARELAVPVFEAVAPDANWTLPDSTIPPYERSQWERRGYRVSQDRRFLQVTDDDGRQGMIPVDQFQLTFVGHEPL